MASIRRHGKGWRAEVFRQGKRRSKVLATKAAAMAWAVDTERELAQDVPTKPVRALLQRYLEDVTSHKRSRQAEEHRVKRLQADELAAVMLADLGPRHITDWRDRALKARSAAAVNRDWNLLNHACNLAMREWEWLRRNPMTAVKRPAATPARARRISQDEIDRLLYACGWPGDTVQARVGDCLLFALETAMRAGEICGLTWPHVHDRHVHIPTTKNGHPRDVPLSAAAREILDRQDKTRTPVFGIATSQLDALFRKARDRAMIDDLHFHDSRREALTRLATRFDVMQLAKISGHRDLRILQNVYYAPTVDDLADQLD